MTVDPCPSCSAAMAADQRYCLSCGDRRAEARLDYLEVLRGAPAPSVAGAPVAPAADSRQRANTTLIASIGCLLLAMGVGVLIGTAGDSEIAAAPASAPAQVIKVQGGGTAASTDTDGAQKKTKKAPAKAKSGGASDVETAATAAESKATNPEIQALDQLSPEEYQKQSQKLPKTVSTGGKAPPIDKSKPAGGGSDFDEIG